MSQEYKISSCYVFGLTWMEFDLIEMNQIINKALNVDQHFLSFSDFLSFLRAIQLRFTNRKWTIKPTDYRWGSDANFRTLNDPSREAWLWLQFPVLTAHYFSANGGVSLWLSFFARCMKCVLLLYRCTKRSVRRKVGRWWRWWRSERRRRTGGRPQVRHKWSLRSF